MDTTAVSRAIEALRGTWEVESGESFGRADYRPVGCKYIFNTGGSFASLTADRGLRQNFVVRQQDGHLSLEYSPTDGPRRRVIRFEINGDRMSWQFSPETVPDVIDNANAPLNGNHRWTLKRISADDEIKLNPDPTIVRHTRDGLLLATETFDEKPGSARALLQVLGKDKNADGNIWHLYSIGKPVTVRELSKISHLPNVEMLNLEGTSVTDTGLELLRPLQRLRVLVLNRTPVTDAGLRVVESLAPLESVHLELAQVTDRGIERLRQRRPELAITFVRESERDRYTRHAAANRISTNRNGDLEEVYLEPETADPARLRDRLAKLPDVTSLNLGGSPITDEVLSEVAGCLRLEELYLWGTAVRGPGLQHLVSLPRLRALHLHCTSSANTGLEHLTAIRALDYLDLGETQLDDAGARLVSQCKSLKSLNVHTTGISNTALQRFASLPELECLWAYETQFDDDGLAALASHPKLIFLSVGRTRVTPAGVAAFRNSRPDIYVAF